MGGVLLTHQVRGRARATTQGSQLLLCRSSSPFLYERKAPVSSLYVACTAQAISSLAVQQIFAAFRCTPAPTPSTHWAESAESQVVLVLNPTHSLGCQEMHSG